MIQLFLCDNSLRVSRSIFLFLNEINLYSMQVYKVLNVSQGPRFFKVKVILLCTGTLKFSNPKYL